MAWTEQCKIDANNQVNHLKKKGMSVRSAIHKLSDESGIPYGTIERWVYPRKNSCVKNDVTMTADEFYAGWKIRFDAFMMVTRQTFEKAVREENLDVLIGMRPIVLEVAQAVAEIHLFACGGETETNKKQKAFS